MYQYPYGNAQQLNLDWILSKIQALAAGEIQVNIEEVANALVSASFDAGVSYRRYDYCFYNGKLYRALNDTTGAFNPSDWLEVVIGDDIPVLTRLINAVDTSLTSLQTTVGNQGTAITNLQNAVGDLDSDDVDNASNVTGTTVTAALDNLNGAITSLDNGKVARLPVYITSLTELDDYVTSEFFITSTDVAIGSTGVTIPAYSRCIFVNSASTDGALIAVTYSGSIISAFRSNGTWINARINTPDSPAFTGTPTAPTAASGTNTTQIATTAFVAAAIQALTTKSVSQQATVGTNITTLELSAVKVGNVVNLYLVFIPTNDLAYTGDVICSNMAYLPFNAMQIPAFCVSGNHIGQATRLMLLQSGQIQTHYSDPTPQAGEAWFVNTSYICN